VENSSDDRWRHSFFGLHVLARDRDLRDVEDLTASLRRPYQPDGSCQAQGEANKVTVEQVAVGKCAR